MARLTYTVLLEPDPDEGGFTVTVAELPGCITQGETVDEALAMAQEVIAPHLEGLAEDGLPVPVEQIPLQLAAVEVDVGALVGV